MIATEETDEVEVDASEYEMEWDGEDLDDYDEPETAGDASWPQEDDSDDGVGYDEMEALIGHVAGRELSAKELGMAQRCAAVIRGCAVYEQIIKGEIEGAEDRVRQLLSQSVTYQEDPPVNETPAEAPAGFRLEDFK